MFVAICKEKINVFGGFESNSQWYLNDTGLKDEFNLTTTQPENPLRTNSYLFVNFKYISTQSIYNESV